MDIEIYHIALTEWLTKRLTWRDRAAPIVFATPDRAFSEMRDLLTLLGPSRGSEGTATLRGQNVPLPFLSLSEAGFDEYDGSRDNFGVIRKMWQTPDEKVAINVDWPTPVTLPYQLDFWCENLRQMRQFRSQIRKLFKMQVAYVFVDFTSPRWLGFDEPIDPALRLLGDRKVALNISSWTDASNLEPAEGKRQIRGNLSMTLNAWLPRDFVRVPICHSIAVELREITSNELIGTSTVPNPSGS